MTQPLIRLAFVFGLALLASVARGQNPETPGGKREVPRPQWAGFGFVSLPESPKTESIRVIESDEEVIIVDLPAAKAN